MLPFPAREYQTDHKISPVRKRMYVTLAWNNGVPSGQMMPCPCYISQIPIWGHRPFSNT